MLSFISLLIFVIIIQAFMVIVSKPITAVLYLIGLYLSVSILLLLTGAEFLAVIIVVLYVGAIIILFIFVIMMLNVRIVEVYNTVISYIPLGIFLGIVFFIEVLYFIYRDLGLRESYIGSSTYTLDGIYEIEQRANNLQTLAEVLYNHYFHFVYIAGLLLLLAMVGAIALTIDPNDRDLIATLQQTYSERKTLKLRIFFGKVKNEK